MGGLGNKLYQIAATIGTARKQTTDYLVPMFDGWEYFPKLRYGTANYQEYKEPEFHYTEISQDNIKLRGYFQSRKYFDHCISEIRQLLTPQVETPHEYSQMKHLKTCSVHVRRGDYLNLKEYHYNIPITWQINAMRNMTDFHFYIFSDDMEFCKKKLSKFANITFVETGNHIMDFYLMSRCDFHIIANSTFSVWASILSGKPVIAPKKSMWFGESNKHKKVDDLYSDSWLIL